MPSRGLSNPRTGVEDQGSGRWNVKDREFQKIRLKAQRVLEGREKFDFDELSLIIARILTEI